MLDKRDLNSQYVFEEGDYYEFYRNIALQAFHYEAITGLIDAIEWVIKFLNKMEHYVKDWFEQYVILVDVGFTMYNYARDAMNRYAIPRYELIQSLELCDEYDKLVDKFLERADIDVQNLRHLKFLANAIHIALVIATLPTNETDDQQQSAIEKSTNIFKFFETEPNVPCPTILMGLHYYLSGKLHHLNKNFGVAWFNYVRAVESLKSWKDSKASQASFYYDVIFGEKSPLFFCNDVIFNVFNSVNLRNA